MILSLTEREGALLRELLESYLPDLKREAARTEKRELRHSMTERQELVEKLLERLSPVAV